jgi:thymidine kinase
MFIEPHLRGEKRGWIEVVTGSMFSGKTEELIRRLRRARIANLRVEIFKPALDTRFDERNIVSHDETYIVSTPVSHSMNILMLSEGMDVVGIDEGQFFDHSHSVEPG